MATHPVHGSLPTPATAQEDEDEDEVSDTDDEGDDDTEEVGVRRIPRRPGGACGRSPPPPAADAGVVPNDELPMVHGSRRTSGLSIPNLVSQFNAKLASLAVEPVVCDRREYKDSQDAKRPRSSCWTGSSSTAHTATSVARLAAASVHRRRCY